MMNYRYKNLLTAIVVVFMITIAGIWGYLLGTQAHQAISKSSQVTLSEKKQPSPSITSVPNEPFRPILTHTLHKIDYQMPRSGRVLEICSYPWDYESPSPPSQGYTECLEFEANGTINKIFYNDVTSSSTLLYSNKLASEEEKVKIAAELRTIYEELTSDKYIDWLKAPRMPALGPNPAIKLYSQESDEQYLVTIYTWGTSFSDEAQRIRNIFAQLQSFSPPTKSSSN